MRNQIAKWSLWSFSRAPCPLSGPGTTFFIFAYFPNRNSGTEIWVHRVLKEQKLLVEKKWLVISKISLFNCAEYTRYSLDDIWRTNFFGYLGHWNISMIWWSAKSDLVPDRSCFIFIFIRLTEILTCHTWNVLTVS